jgi:uncharacterized protein (TIGR03000 family)
MVMVKRWWWGAAILALAAAAVLLQPQMSEAQRRGGGGRGYGLGRGGYGGYSRGFYNRGYYNRGYGLGYGGLGYGGYGLGYGGYGLGGYGGYGLGYGGYGLGGYGGYGLLGGYGLGSGLGLGLLSRGWGYGGYGGSGYSSSYVSPYYAYTPGYTYSPGYYTYGGTTGSYQSFYPPETMTGSVGASPNEVHLLVVVPEDNAQVLIDGNPTRQTGHEREFVTEMNPGTAGIYHVTARWKENGQAHEETRDVRVRPGAWRVVDFNQSLGTTTTNPAPRQVTTPAVGTKRSTVTPAANATDGVPNPMPPLATPPNPRPGTAPPAATGEPRDDTRDRNPGTANPPAGNRPQPAPPPRPVTPPDNPPP